jgi:hypothetical protein
MKPSVLVFLFLGACWSVSAQHRKVRLPAELKEISGIAYLPNQSLWALNDGGNAANIYKIDQKTGKILEKRPLPISNNDWEDLQSDGKGNLWIGDIGNNLNHRKQLRFYRYHITTGHIDSLSFSYPDQIAFPPSTEVARSFDAEAFVCIHDTLHVFTKSRFKGNHFTKHYTIPATPGHHTATLRDSLYLPKRAVSGAAMSTDGQTLVLVAYYYKLRKFWLPYTRTNAYFITGFSGSNYLKGQVTSQRLPKVFVSRQFESISAFSGKTWLIANEGILWQKPRLWRLTKKY